MAASIDKRPVSLEEAQRIAAELIELFNPVTERIEIAGSVRRGKPMCSDIEVVLIGKRSLDLFGQPSAGPTQLDLFCDDLRSQHRLTERRDKNGNPTWGYGARYAWYVPVWDDPREPVAVDLFGTDPDRWGVTMVIRTGPASFSQRLVTRGGDGWMPFGMRIEGGWLWDGSRKVPTPEEDDVFRAINRPYIAPEERR